MCACCLPCTVPFACVLIMTTHSCTPTPPKTQRQPHQHGLDSMASVVFEGGCRQEAHRLSAWRAVLCAGLQRHGCVDSPATGQRGRGPGREAHRLFAQSHSLHGRAAKVFLAKQFCCGVAGCLSPERHPKTDCGPRTPALLWFCGGCTCSRGAASGRCLLRHVFKAACFTLQSWACCREIAHCCMVWWGDAWLHGTDRHLFLLRRRFPGPCHAVYVVCSLRHSVWWSSGARVAGTGGCQAHFSTGTLRLRLPLLLVFTR